MMSVASGDESINSEVEPKSPSPSPPPVKKFARRYGTRAEVFDSETAEMTRGGLRKADLILSRSGKIVSKRKSESAKKIYNEFGFKKRVKKVEVQKKKKKRGKRKRSK